MEIDEVKVEEKITPSLDIGALLVEARENKNLSSQDIAEQMYLALDVILQLEENQFDQALPHTFIRGYLRSYAQKVGVDAENICVEFDRQTGFSNEPLKNMDVVSSFGRRRKEFNSNSIVFKIVTLIIVISLLIFAGWEVSKKYDSWFGSETNLKTIELSEETGEVEVNSDNRSYAIKNESNQVDINPVSKSENKKMVASDDTTVSENIIASENIESIKNVASIKSAESQESKIKSSEPELSNTSEITSEKADGNIKSTQEVFVKPAKIDNVSVVNPPAILEPVVSLNFIFNGDCWVKITDVNGEVLAVGVKQQDKIMSVSGVAPVSVILGDPAVVELTYQGQPYDLSSYRSGRRAKFTLN